MALQVSYQTAMGFVSPEAYLRIVSFSGDKTNLIVNVEFHHNKISRDTGCNGVGSKTIFLEMSGGATMQQMYDALKLDSNFAGAIDA